MLDWSDDGKSIIVNNENGVKPSNSQINEANADDINDKILRWYRNRRGQNKFRMNLHRVYGYQCVISKCKVEDMLLDLIRLFTVKVVYR